MSSSGPIGGGGEVGPGGVLIPGLVVGQAPPQASDELVGEVAQCGVVVIAGRSPFVVIGSCSGGLGERRECLPVAGVTETLVADLASFHVVRATRGDGDRCGACERAKARRVIEAC